MTVHVKLEALSYCPVHGKYNLVLHTTILQHAVCIIQHGDLQLSNTGHVLCTVFVLHTTLMLQHKTDCPARGQVLKCLSCTRQWCCSTRQIVQHGTTVVLHGTTHSERLTLNRSANKRTTWIPLFWSRIAGLTALFLIVSIISICGTIF